MILNLDEFIEEINEITLKGTKYKVPSDIPTLMYLELAKANQESAIEGMKKGIAVMHKIFQIHQPKLKFDDFSKLITNNTYAAIINFFTAGMSVEETKKLLEEAKERIKDSKKKPIPAKN